MSIEAVDLYKKIPIHQRNKISQVCTLNGCSHSGLVNKAWNICNEINLETEKIITIMLILISIINSIILYFTYRF